MGLTDAWQLHRPLSAHNAGRANKALCERHSKVQDRLSPGTAKWTFPLIVHSTSTNPLQAYILTMPRVHYKCHCKMYEAQ